MLIKRDNLLIRTATYNDLGILCTWWNDGKVMEHAGFPNGLGTTENEVKKIIDRNSINNSVLIIEFNNKPIGEMSYRKVTDNTAEIGIKICDFSMQEKGNGTRFLQLLINYLFSDLGFTKINLDTNIKNSRAQHVYEKIGFKKVRVNIDAWKNQLGVLQTSIDYELTKEDFNNY